MKMIIVKILRPDRLVYATWTLIEKVLGENVTSQSQLDFDATVENGTIARSPLLLVSAPGYDASVIVDQLAKTKMKKCASVAIGSPEAFEECF